MAIFSKAKIREIFEDAEIEVSKDVLKKIFDLHTDSIEDLKDTVKELKTDLENAERERDDYKAKAPKEGEENPFEKKYNDLKVEHDKLKTDIANEKAKKAKTKVFRELMKSENIEEDWYDIVLQASESDINSIELDQDGKATNADKIAENLKTKWAKCVKSTTEVGANTKTPPAGGGGSDKSISRAKQLANEYHTNLYGKVKES